MMNQVCESLSVRCPECGGAVFPDEIRGEVTCHSCGMVVEQLMLLPSVKSAIKPGRLGSCDVGLKYRSSGSTGRTGAYIYYERLVTELCAELEAPEKVLEQALSILRVAVVGKFWGTLSRYNSGTAAAIVYVAHRNCGLPVNVAKLSGWLGVGVKEAMRLKAKLPPRSTARRNCFYSALLTLVRDVGMVKNTARVVALFSAVKRLRLTGDVAYRIFEVVEFFNGFDDSTPEIVMPGCVVIACTELSAGFSMRRLADEFGAAESEIRAAAEKLRSASFL